MDNPGLSLVLSRTGRLSAVLRQLVVFGWLGGFGALVVRTHLTEDDRFGLCMFRDIIVYEVAYSWVMSDGTKIPLNTRGDLYGQARLIRPTGKSRRDTILGLGFLRTEIHGYVRWAWENRSRKAGAVAVSAELSTRPFDRGQRRIETLQWP